MKKFAQSLTMAGFVVAVGAVMMTASMSAAGRAGDQVGKFPCGPRYCLDVWRPVICSGGGVYSNDCYAARECATGCVPWGGETE